jgi:hypothetical protein
VFDCFRLRKSTMALSQVPETGFAYAGWYRSSTTPDVIARASSSFNRTRSSLGLNIGFPPPSRIGLRPMRYSSIRPLFVSESVRSALPKMNRSFLPSYFRRPTVSSARPFASCVLFHSAVWKTTFGMAFMNCAVSPLAVDQ